MPGISGNIAPNEPIRDWNDNYIAQPRQIMRIDTDTVSREDDASMNGDYEFGLTWINDIDEASPQQQMTQTMSLFSIPTFNSSEMDDTYKLNRTLTTIPQVWEEYTVGINGNPSIRSLESQFGDKWRLGSERYFYWKQKVIYRYIEQLISQGIPEQDAVSQTEANRVNMGLTLYRFRLHLVQLRKEMNSGPQTTTYEIYRFNRTISTVGQVWQEYTRGLNGNPTVKDLEAEYGAKWRNSDAERNFFSGRKRIYEMVDTLIGMGQTEDEAVDKVEELRATNNWSLNRLQSSLKFYNVSNGSIERRTNEFDSIAYCQFTNLSTVPQVWQEYTMGIYGQPSIRSLDIEYGSRWRNTSAAGKLYSGRKAIYNAIESKISQGTVENEAVNEFETMRKQYNWSLNQLQQHISKGKKQNKMNQVPEYKQYRNLTTIRDIWNEYKVGINGNPSVESLDSTYGPQWRGKGVDRTFYYRRKKIYSVVESLVSHGMSEEEAVASLDKYIWEKCHQPPWLEYNGAEVVELLSAEWARSKSANSTTIS